MHNPSPKRVGKLLVSNVQLALDLIAKTGFLAGPRSTGVGFFGRGFNSGAIRAEIVLDSGLVEETFVRKVEDMISS